MVGPVFAEVMGFPIILEQIVPGGLENSDCRKIGQPPEASPFFIEGEELWDVKKAFQNAHPGEALPEWIVWQPRTKIVIAKGSPSALWHIHRRMSSEEGISVNGLLKIELFEAPSDHSPWSGHSKLLTSLSWTNRSGFGTSASGKSDQGNRLEVESEVFGSAMSPWFRGQIVMEYGGPEKAVFSMYSGFILRSGRPLWLARFELEGKGYDLVLSGALERFDGGPIADHVLVPDGNDVRQIHWSKAQSDVQTIGDGKMVSYPFLSAMLENAWHEHLGGEAGKIPMDPFEPLKAREGMPARFTEIPVPKELVGILGDRAIDMNDLAAQISGLPLDNDFAAYDLKRGTLVYFTRNKDRSSRMEGMFAPFCRLPHKVVAFSSEDGRFRLAGLAGDRIWMEVKHDTNNLFGLKVEPNFAEDQSIESSVEFSDKARGLIYNGEMTFREGKMTPVTKSEGGNLAMRVDSITVYE